ncbi:MAG: hypothetical protein AAGA25_14110 [Planctomycetota bacterium]
MKKTCVLFFSTELFDTNPDYEADHPDYPPPGYMAASKLRLFLAKRGMEYRTDELSKDYWEHSNWFDLGIWKQVKYSFIIQTNCAFESPLRIYVGVSRQVGIFKSLFGKRLLAFEIQSELMGLIADFCREHSDDGEIEFMAFDDASQVIWEV